MRRVSPWILVSLVFAVSAQAESISVRVEQEDGSPASVLVELRGNGLSQTRFTSEQGLANFEVGPGNYSLVVVPGEAFKTERKRVRLAQGSSLNEHFTIQASAPKEVVQVKGDNLIQVGPPVKIDSETPRNTSVANCGGTLAAAAVYGSPSNATIKAGVAH